MSELSKIATQVTKAAASALKQMALPSIVAAIERDHMDLRSYIKILKSDSDLREKKKAYSEFTQLLKSHSKAEEKSVYPYCVKVAGMEVETHEGYAEHGLAEELMTKIAHIRDPQKWEAHAKVLAELVEHHAAEEERAFLPKLKAKVEELELEKLRTKFVKVRRETQGHPEENNSGVLVA